MAKKYKHILVPLDGSELAELALDDALNLADLNQAEITLIMVIRPAEHVIGVETGYPIYLDQQWQNQKFMATEYLKEVARRPVFTGKTVRKVVELGADAETILDFAKQHPIDLIVMATHGRSGLTRWVYGSVADKVLRGATVPVLLVRAHPVAESV